MTAEEPHDAPSRHGERDYVARNRGVWNRWAADFVPPGGAAWASDDPYWGIWKVPEAELHALPADLDGKDTVELGCGTGYVSAWLARRGARPVGVDLSKEQLATARRLQGEHGLVFPLLEGNAEELPFPDASFDLAISEYGASIWADPYRFEWSDGREVEFHLGYGEMIRLLRASRFEVEDLIEVRPGSDSEPHADLGGMVSLDWSRHWPCEQIWKARKASV